MKEILQELGLTGNEARVYEVLVQYESLTGNSLAKKSGIDRSVTYNLLNSLAQKGLVSNVTIQNKKHYTVQPPETLKADIERKQFYADKLIDTINTIRKQADKDKTVEIYEGIAATRRLYSIVEFVRPAIMRSIGGSGEIANRMREELEYYVQNAHQKGIEVRILTAADRSGLEDIEQVFEIRRTPIPNLPISITSGEDTVYIHDYEHDARLIIIRNELCATLVNALFDMIWDFATPSKQ